MSRTQLLACVDASSLAAKPLPVEQMRAGEFRRDARDDPPIGIVYDHERNIYMGNGDWQPLED